MKQIAILDDYQGAAIAFADWKRLEGRAGITVFSETLQPDDLPAKLAGFHILVLNRERTPVTRALLERLPELELIVTFGMRNASLDIAAAADRDVMVCGTRTLGYPTSELTWALILAQARKLQVELHAIRENRWQTTVGQGLRGKTLGIAGYGRIGRDVAKVGLAFGMRVLAFSRSLSDADANADGVERTDWPVLLEQSDILSLHLPLNTATRGILNGDAIRLMKPGAILVNTARGGLIDEDALLTALDKGSIAGAALDTFEAEPVRADTPFARFDNVILTPHLGYVIEDNYRVTFGDALEDILAWLNGSPIRVLGDAR